MLPELSEAAEQLSEQLNSEFRIQHSEFGIPSDKEEFPVSVKRIYVEKMADYAVEAKNLLWEIRHILQIKSITDLRLLNRYDVEGVADDLYLK